MIVLLRGFSRKGNIMRIDVREKARIFARQLQGQNGPYISYSTSMGRKKQDGSWDNARLYVEFQNGCPVPENIGPKGVEIDIVDGWLVFRNYQATTGGKPVVDKEGKPVMRTLFGVHVKEWRYADGAAPKQAQIPDSFAVVDEDEPW